MKATIHRSLLEELLNHVSGGLKSDDPISELIVLSTEKQTISQYWLSASVFNEHLCCSAKINGSKDKSLLDISEFGKVSVVGETLINAVKSLKECEQKLSLEFEPIKKESADNDEDEGLAGTLKIKAGEDEIRLQCFERTFDTNTSNKLSVSTIKGSTLHRCCQKTGISAGKIIANDEWANVHISASKNNNEITLVTTNGQQLTIGKIAAEEIKEDFCAILPYEIMRCVTKMCDGDEDVEISLSTDKPTKTLFSKKILYADISEIGMATYQISPITDKFPNFEKLLSRLSWVTTCKIDANILKSVCNSLDIFDQVRTFMSLTIKDNKIGELVFHKTVDKGTTKRKISVKDASGENIELNISSRHLQVAVGQASINEITMYLSGSKSMGKLDLGDGIAMFFQPFSK